MVIQVFPAFIYRRSSGPSSTVSVQTYTGTGSAQSITTDFSPDLVWTVNRPTATNIFRGIFNTVRGATKYLPINLNTAETTDATTLTSFDSSGFSIGTSALLNQSTINYLALSFKIGSAYGFNMFTYTGNGVSGRALAHGLPSTPGFYFVKQINSGNATIVWTTGINVSTDFFFANSSGSTATNLGRLTGFADSTNIYLGTNSTVNSSPNTYLFCGWCPVSGLSSFGTYTGNGSTTGPAITGLGFQPKALMIKYLRGGTGSGPFLWFDNVRSTSNPRLLGMPMLWEGQNETSYSGGIDFNSDGFQIKSSNNVLNNNTAIYSYWALK